jgi:hypothetical protein
MNLEETIRHLKDSDSSEDTIVAEFAEDLEPDIIEASMDEIIGAARAVKKAVEKPVLKIHADGDSESPRQWDNLGTMVCWHDRYVLGDERPGGSPDGYFDDEEPFVRLPLYLYDHGGITMSTGPFSCPWDSGQVGWIYVTLDQVKKEFGVKAVNGAIKKKVIACLESEVRVYDQYLRGAVWGYEYGDDSCWGFLGDTLEETGLLEAIDAPRQVVDAAWGARS